MKTDRELLELAARAAGINGIYIETACGPCISIVDAYGAWRPLIDDGDALRLAVKLGLWIDIQRGITEVWVQGPDLNNCELEKQRFNADPYAATRRAIVRAAAAIGESM